MIDIATETILTFAEACRHLPRRRRGRKAHPSTLWRWGTRGLRGIRLELIKVGGQSCTSLEALQRFFDRLTGPGPEDEREDAPMISCSRHATRRQADVEKELAKWGL